MKRGSCLDGDRSFSVCACDMNRLELVLRVTEMLGQVPHLINVGLFSRAKLSIHVPLEDAFEAL